MKKSIILLFAASLFLAACGSSSEKETIKSDSTQLSIDSVSVDTTAVKTDTVAQIKK